MEGSSWDIRGICYNIRGTASSFYYINGYKMDQVFFKRWYHRSSFIIIHSFISYAPDPTSPLKPHRAIIPAPSKVIKQSNPPQATPLKSNPPDTPPNSPTTSIPNPLEFAQQVIDTVKLIQISESKKTSPSAEPYIKEDTKPAEAKARASKLKYKTVDEVYVSSLLLRLFWRFYRIIGMATYPGTKSRSQPPKKRWYILTNIHSLFVLELVGWQKYGLP